MIRTLNKLDGKFTTLADNSELNGFNSVKTELNELLNEVQSAMNRAAVGNRSVFNQLFSLRDELSNFIECRGDLNWISEREYEARMLGEDSSFNSRYCTTEGDDY